MRNKKRMLVVSTLIFGALLPQSAPAAGPSDLQRYCFICDDYEGEGGWWKHNDYQLFLNDKEGEVLHFQSYLSCAIHAPYGLDQ